MLYIYCLAKIACQCDAVPGLSVFKTRRPLIAVFKTRWGAVRWDVFAIDIYFLSEYRHTTAYPWCSSIPCGEHRIHSLLCYLRSILR